MGKWSDMALFEKVILDSPANREPLLPFAELDQAKVTSILREFTAFLG